MAHNGNINALKNCIVGLRESDYSFKSLLFIFIFILWLVNRYYNFLSYWNGLKQLVAGQLMIIWYKQIGSHTLCKK